MFHVAIDTRETKIIEYMKAEKLQFQDSSGKEIKYTVEHLAVGDFIIFRDDVAILVIERKTWKDLAAGFYDGRKENIKKMVDYGAQTGARLAYIFEGPAFPSPSTKYGKIPYKNLRAHIDHLLYRDNIMELRSQNKTHTIERIFEFVRNLSTLEIFQEKKEGGDSHLKIAKTAIKNSPEHYYTLVWAAFPHVGMLTAKLLTRWSISEFFSGAVTAADVAALQYSTGGVIGDQKAKKIMAIVSKGTSKQYSKILSRIPRIGTDVAKLIAEVPDLFTDRKRLDGIAAIKKNNKPLHNAKNIVKVLDQYIFQKLPAE
jgi:ERCC4-type nuclease